MRRATICFVLLAMLAALPLGVAAITPFPSQAVKLVVAQAPGGQNDIIARAFAQRLSDLWKQPVVIVNFGGVGGTMGADIAAKAPADGYTLFFGGSNNLVLAPILMPNLAYHPATDFIAIGAVARTAYALAVNARVPVRTVAELVAYARANPGRLNYGSSGNGSTSALGAELLMAATHIDMVQVPYKGTAPAIADLVAGHIDLMFADLSQLLPHANAGSLYLLASAGESRAPAAPGLPTIGEQGVAGVTIESWYGLLAPRGVPREIVATLTGALVEILREPDFRQQLTMLGYDPIDSTGERFGAMIESDIRRYAAIIKRAGIPTVP